MIRQDMALLSVFVNAVDLIVGIDSAGSDTAGFSGVSVLLVLISMKSLEFLSSTAYFQVSFEEDVIAYKIMSHSTNWGYHISETSC